jgi:hypothetical protein
VRRALLATGHRALQKAKSGSVSRIIDGVQTKSAGDCEQIGVTTIRKHLQQVTDSAGRTFMRSRMQQSSQTLHGSIFLYLSQSSSKAYKETRGDGTDGDSLEFKSIEYNELRICKW